MSTLIDCAQILPGAPVSFLQEVAVLQSDADSPPGMYVIGQTNRKFVVAPELGRLLTQNAIERRERAERAKRAADEERIRVKQEEEEKLLAAAKKKAAGPSTTAKKPTASKARPKPVTKASAPKEATSK